jgi:hypothetical protein
MAEIKSTGDEFWKQQKKDKINIKNPQAINQPLADFLYAQNTCYPILPVI